MTRLTNATRIKRRGFLAVERGAGDRRTARTPDQVVNQFLGPSRQIRNIRNPPDGVDEDIELHALGRAGLGVHELAKGWLRGDRSHNVEFLLPY